MSDGATLPIVDGIALPMAELTFETSRSQGPGGQNVNKVESRVTVAYPLASSTLFDERQRALIQERLRTRISRAGVLRVSAQKHRSQSHNREEALLRLAELLRDALAEDAERRPTKTPKRAKRRRVADKRLRGARKQLRSRPDASD